MEERIKSSDGKGNLDKALDSSVSATGSSMGKLSRTSDARCQIGGSLLCKPTATRQNATAGFFHIFQLHLRSISSHICNSILVSVFDHVQDAVSCIGRLVVSRAFCGPILPMKLGDIRDASRQIDSYFKIQI